MKKERLLDIVVGKYNFDVKKATGLILSGNVLVEERPITKIGVKIDKTKNIRIKEDRKYVSRGAYKLLTALDNFLISIKDKVCLDCGCSKGGFTQVLLERGAKKVYAVDCGINQLDYSLRKNDKIILMENVKVNDLILSNFNEKIDLAVMDVSFCSSLNLINYIYKKLIINEFVVLIKPQFEYTRLKSRLKLSNNFNGIVKNSEDRDKIIKNITKEIIDLGLNIFGIIPSAIKGVKGNIEYLFYIGK
jgi:23S rRNA (cytidine1920-2'-O)/16S rRNA (cytidine1409-2'-O)-methyltransferase